MDPTRWVVAEAWLSLGLRLRWARKPYEVAKRIVDLCVDVPRLELFARQRIAWWDAWGDKLDPGDVSPLAREVLG